MSHRLYHVRPCLRLGRVLISVILLLSLLLTSCGPTGTPEPSYAVDTRQVAASNALGFDLLSALYAENKAGNVFISPLSIHMALSMTYNGAANATQEAMADALRLDGLTLQELNEASAGLGQSLDRAIKADSKAVSFSLANSIWAREGAAFYDEFMERNQLYYDAEVGVLDFGDDKAARTINRWVERATKRRIKEIVQAPINPLTVMFLINAVHFKGAWQTPFDKKQTEQRPFYLPDGQQQQVPLMSLRHTLAYAQGESWQMVSLPYGDEGRLSMIVLLPEDRFGAETLLENLDASRWQEMVRGMEKTKGFVAMPRFSVEYKATLNEALQALGMGVAFDPNHADFSRLRPIPPNVYISEVKHKTFIEVNEEGAEAAAATSVEITLKSALVKTFNMVADHPFIYGIQDNETEALLFLGLMNAPQ